MMRCSNLEPYLDTIVSNQDVKVGKPDPEIYLRTMQLLDVAPDQCLVVEDNEHGITAARSAGAHLLVVRQTTDVTYDAISGRISQIELLS